MSGAFRDNYSQADYCCNDYCRADYTGLHNVNLICQKRSAKKVMKLTNRERL